MDVVITCGAVSKALQNRRSGRKSLRKLAYRCLRNLCGARVIVDLKWVRSILPSLVCCLGIWQQLYTCSFLHDKTITIDCDCKLLYINGLT